MAEGKIRINAFAVGIQGPGKAVVLGSGATVGDLLAKCAEKFPSLRTPPTRAFLLRDDSVPPAKAFSELIPATATLSSLGVKHDSVVHVSSGEEIAPANSPPSVSAVAPNEAPPKEAAKQPQHSDKPNGAAEPKVEEPKAAAPSKANSSREGFSMSASLDVVHGENGASSYTMDVQFDTPPPRDRRTLLVLLADQSASMRPSWHQVQQALLYIMGESFGQELFSVEVVLYQTTSKRLAVTAENYEEVIMAERAHGSTDFGLAFELCHEIVAEYARRCPALDVVVGLMTDGNHSTPRSALASYTALRELLHSLGDSCSSSVNCIGFTDGHKFDVLDRIRRELGQSEGTYQYADPSDGRTALRRKLESLFDAASVFGGRLTARLSVTELLFCNPPPGTGLSPEITLPVVLDRDGKASLRMKLRVPPDTFIGEKTAVALCCDLSNERGTAVCELSCQPTITVTTGPTATVVLSLRSLSDRVDELFGILGKLTEAPSLETSAKYNSQLGDVQEQLKVFEDATLFALPRSYRSQLLELRASLHLRVAQMLDILAHFARGVFSSVTKARLADLAYGGSFTNNRQRRVDKRVARNALLLADDTTRLLELVVDPARTRGVSDESKTLFSCVMSLGDWTELAQEKDVCGFGLAVSRPDWVVDDPTSMRVLTISNTCLSKSSMEDALRCSIDLHGHMKTTGGFGIGSEMGVAVRGRGREPINSWLPLYINAEHWEVCRILLRQIMGYFVVLDPLAFSPNQIDAFFLVLGTMAARLASGGCGEHALKLMLQFQRTCLETARHFGNIPAMEAALIRFISCCPYETRDQVKNLVAVAAYVFVLPAESLSRVFPSDREWERFWTNLAVIAVRRSAFSIFNDSDESCPDGVIDRILYGTAHCHTKGPRGETDLLDHESFVRTVTLLATAGADTEDKFEDCLLEVPTAADDPAEQDPMNPTGLSAATVHRFILQMERRGYPTMNALHSLLTFATCWVRMQRDFAASPKCHDHSNLLEVLDDTWGIASDAMIATVKRAFHDVQGSGNVTIGKFFTQLLGPRANPVYASTLVRAVVAMGIQFRVNKPARDAIDAGVFMDPHLDPARCIDVLHRRFRERRENSIRLARQSAALVMQANSAIASTDVLVFVDWVQAQCPSGHRFSPSFKKIISKFNRSADGGALIMRDDSLMRKLVALLTGRLYTTNEAGQTEVVWLFVNPTMWIPGSRTNNRIGYGFIDAASIHALFEDYLVHSGKLPKQ